ncbi:energy-coupled thiamine transporter ThiT, partial [Klebsiella pneumoniae]
SYAPKGMSATLYSLSVNGTAGLLTLFFVVISIIILVISYPSFFLPKK